MSKVTQAAWAQREVKLKAHFVSSHLRKKRRLTHSSLPRTLTQDKHKMSENIHDMSRPEVLRVRMALNLLMMVPGWRPSHHLSEAQQGQAHLQHLNGWLLLQ